MKSLQSIDIKRFWPIAVSLLFGCVMYWFWRVPYVSMLSYHEQYQLFTFDIEYFLERIVVPGGLADYLSEFVVQFFYTPSFGALLLALLFVALQCVFWLICRSFGAIKCWYSLSFVPAFLLWFMMSDENIMPTLPMALLANLAFSLAYFRWRKWLLAVVIVPLSYWLFGPAVVVFVIIAVLTEINLKRYQSAIYLAVALVLVALLSAILSSYRPYEFHRFFVGINYYRYAQYDPTVQIVVTFLCAVLPFAIGKIRPIKVVPAVAVSVVVFAVGGVLIRGAFNLQKHELIEYEYLVRSEQWQKIIDKAELRPAMTPMSVACVNLALSQKGLLCDRIFEFFQNGTEGLIPPFLRNMTSPILTAEIFLRLGMVNDAHRYFFEAQEAIPNYRRSARLTKRLVQCEIVNGNYDVARKWLHQLERTIFYKKWARNTLRILDNEAAVAKEPFYANLRSIRHNGNDYLFSDTEMDQMLGLLFMCNKHNRMAYEYLMCYVLLQYNLEKFMSYYSLGKYVGYQRIPRAIQEVLIGSWLQKNSDPKSIPYSVDGATLSNTMNFIRIYSKNHNDPQLDRTPYKSNAWHYLLKGSVTERTADDRHEIY